MRVREPPRGNLLSSNTEACAESGGSRGREGCEGGVGRAQGTESTKNMVWSDVHRGGGGNVIEGGQRR